MSTTRLVVVGQTDPTECDGCEGDRCLGGCPILAGERAYEAAPATARPKYWTREPRGWCGDPSRGAALGRPTYGGSADFSGRITLRRVRLNSGGYDCLGTYWGVGAPLFWYADDSGTIDGCLRASSRDAAKAKLRKPYPQVRFWR